MKELKAVELLQEILTNLLKEQREVYKSGDIDEELDGGIIRFQNSIAELEQLQSKLKSLEQYCEEQKDTWESQENGDHKVYEKILEKLRS